jgi:hypothetical protein
MTFEEMIDTLRGLDGKTVEVSVAIPRLGDEPFGVASFSGVADRVAEGEGGGSGVWRLWLGEPHDLLNVASFDRSLFLAADFVADREEADQERVGESGMTWTLTIRQAGAQTEIIVYV